MAYVLGVDIGGTNIRLGLVDEENRLTGYRKVPQESILSGGDTVESLALYLEEYLRENAQGKEIEALVAGIPAAMSWPPSWDDFSARITSCPRMAATRAASIPAAPPPTTSTRFFSGGICRSLSQYSSCPIS